MNEITIVDGKISVIGKNQVPVILIDSDDAEKFAALIANFLRSGCPAVQVIFDSKMAGDEQKVIDKIRDILFSIRIGAEKFVSTTPQESDKYEVFHFSFFRS